LTALQPTKVTTVPLVIVPAPVALTVMLEPVWFAPFTLEAVPAPFVWTLTFWSMP
jgi:hypothetical protein